MSVRVDETPQVGSCCSSLKTSPSNQPSLSQRPGPSSTSHCRDGSCPSVRAEGPPVFGGAGAADHGEQSEAIQLPGVWLTAHVCLCHPLSPGT